MGSIVVPNSVLLWLYMLLGALDTLLYIYFSSNVASGFYDAQMMRGLTLPSFYGSLFCIDMIFMLVFTGLFTLFFYMVFTLPSYGILVLLFGIAQSLFHCVTCYFLFGKYRLQREYGVFGIFTVYMVVIVLAQIFGSFLNNINRFE